MASSGWQGQIDVQTQKYPHMALNLNVWDVVHSGTTLTFKGTVRVICTSGWIAYNNASVSLTGSGSQSINLNFGTGGYADSGTFNCTVSNVPASQGWYNVSASLSAGGTASGTANWTLNIGGGGDPPGGTSIRYDGCTWDSISATTSCTSTGGLNVIYASTIVVGSYNGEIDNLMAWDDAHGIQGFSSQPTSAMDFYSLFTNETCVFKDYNPIPIKGLLHYKLNGSVQNSVGTTEYFDPTLRYLPPAPGQLTYTDPGGGGAKVYPVSYTGVVANNHTTYDSASLTRTIRYKIDNGNWVYVDNATVAAIDFVTNFNLTIPAASTATVEAWMDYHGEQSEVSTVVISNTNLGCTLYGSVSGETKKLGPVYASVNGQTKKLVKIYASVNGVTKKVYEDV